MHVNSARKRSVPWDDSSPMTTLGGPGSEVFRAPSVDGDRYVAVRLWCGTSREEMDAALARIQCANRVSHASLARVEACEARGNAALWIVSEFVPGPSLEVWAARGRMLPVPGVIDLVRNLCLGLYAAHREGLSHHAIHPGNLLVSRQSRAEELWLETKLLDLSLAAWMQPEWPSLPHTHFMAPETLASMLDGVDPSDAIDARANVYSCGALLYFLTTGALPFRSPGLQELSTAQSIGKLWAPQGHNPDVSNALQTVILGALAVKPSGRYANPGELASALAAAAWRDGFADSYEPSVVAPLPLLQMTEQRERRTSVVQEVSERILNDEVTDTSDRTEPSRTAWSKIRDAL
jgi:serine/threonine protein kinase